ncbi:hypothetical protein H5410_030297 [Solanum commersonii]|uniref:Uncharacterized protein n=1 Tax=Solanum commersonii TaxID=4109 RepID=A0A9J5YGG3_SOLCO|nr:hypothetical protein H5410_030297 [Solanum commersonii]
MFYRVVVRLTLLYRVQCSPIKNSYVQKMQIAEMRMLRWMCRHIRSDKIRNVDIQDKVSGDTNCTKKLFVQSTNPNLPTKLDFEDTCAGGIIFEESEHPSLELGSITHYNNQVLRNWTKGGARFAIAIS